MCQCIRTRGMPRAATTTGVSSDGIYNKVVGKVVEQTEKNGEDWGRAVWFHAREVNH